MNLTDFEKMIEEDNKIFFDLEEFAEIHLINKKQVRVIIDNNEQLKREKTDMKSKEGLSKKKISFYVIAKEFGELPYARSLLEFDNNLYNVVDAINEKGIYFIALELYRSR